MKDYYKTITHDIFQKLIVLSVFLIPLFFWPNHEPRLMKFICFQTTVMIMLAFSFMFTPKRTIDNFYPGLFVLLGFLNLFTHGMSDFVNVGMGFIMTAVIGIYVVSNHLHIDNVPLIKKSIVILCIINCALFLTQKMGLNIVFLPDEHGRPSGFMCYPASFAMLCAISLFLSWEWKKWLCTPIALCLIMSNEFSVILGLIVAFCFGVRWRFTRHCLVLIPVILTLGIIGWHLWPAIYSKSLIRFKYLYPVIQNVWARPIDGWGVGMYNRLPDSFFGFPRGNWSEMHCEPLDLFFCMGIMGVAIVVGWIKKVSNYTYMNYKKIFIVFGITSCFHSPFHFADTLWLFVILYSLMEIENEEYSS